MPRHLITSLIATALCVALSGCATETDSVDCEALQSSLREVLEDQSRSHPDEFPGVVVAVETPQCGVIVETSGSADLEAGTAMSADHALPLGNITRTFVAAVALQLVDEEALDPQQPVAELVAGAPGDDEITIQALLDHTSGLPDYVQQCAGERLGDPAATWAPADLVACAADAEPSFAPGEGREISRTNDILLAMAIEAATGQSIETEVRDRILVPLGLEATFFGSADGEAMAASCYSGSGYEICGAYDSSWHWAAGAMAASAEDLLTFAGAIIEGTVVTGVSREALIADVVGQRVLYGREDSIALDATSFVTADLPRTADVATAADGAAELFHVPAWDTTFTVMVNHTPFDIDAEYDELLDGVAEALADSLADR